MNITEILPTTPILLLTVEQFRQLIIDTISEAKQADKKRDMTLPEVAAYLRIATNTVYQMVHKEGMPHTKDKKYLRFNKADIDTWNEVRESAKILRRKKGKKSKHDETEIDMVDIESNKTVEGTI